MPADHPTCPSKSDKAARPRFLLVAYSCEPNRGSEPGIGWHRALHAASVADTWVLCHQQGRCSSVRLLDSGAHELRPRQQTQADRNGPLRLLWCGVLEPRQALDWLLEAIAILPDAVRVDETCGIKIPVTNRAEAAAGFRDAIVRLATDDALRNRLSAGTYRRAETFLWRSNNRQMTRIYDKVLRGAGHDFDFSASHNVPAEVDAPAVFSAA